MLGVNFRVVVSYTCVIFRSPS